MRLGILASHPIQYHAPWFRALAKQIDLHVFFADRQSAVEQGKAGFGVPFDWDVDLLSGYKHTFLKNKARNPSVNHFLGCDTPEIKEIIGGQRTEDSGSQGANYTAGGTENLSVSREAGGSALVKTEITDNARSVFDAFIVCGWNLKSYWQAIRACRRAGIPLLLMVWERAALKDAELLLVGAWQLSDSARGKLPSNVKYLAPCSAIELRTHYQSADVFVFPSYFEGFGLVLLEAMACGLPVLSSECTAAPDILTKESGSIVPGRQFKCLGRSASLNWREP